MTHVPTNAQPGIGQVPHTAEIATVRAINAARTMIESKLCDESRFTEEEIAEFLDAKFPAYDDLLAACEAAIPMLYLAIHEAGRRDDITFCERLGETAVAIKSAIAKATA